MSLFRVWVHCPRASNGLLPRRSNLVGYMQWDAWFDRFLLVKQSIQRLYRSQPTIETGIGPREDRLDAFGQGRADTLHMACDLLPIGPIAIAQFSPNVFVGFGHKGENGLIAFLAFVFRVIALAGTHLPAIERVHGGVGVQCD
jgi:hypothetical protein